MKILVACEESQRVTTEFRIKGHEAYSCDIIDCSGGYPEWHIRGDVLPLLNGNCTFKTCDDVVHEVKGKWDMIIGFPPCTYLCVAGNRWFNVEKYGQKALDRIENREKAKEFFMEIANADCDRIAIENPIGIMSKEFRKPDQIIHPFWFGEPYTKQTCIWLKGLPKLEPTDMLEKPKGGWENQMISKDGEYGGFGGTWGRDERGKYLRYGDPRVAKERSKTFHGVAKAMAEQWSNINN